jgi:hypothetical protein
MDDPSPQALRGAYALAPGFTDEEPPIDASPFFEFRAGAMFGIDGPHDDKKGTPDVNLELL